MPATASQRVARRRPAPPARSSVRRIWPRAPRASSSAATLSAIPIGIAHTASRRWIFPVCRDAATAAGTTRTPHRAAISASEARWLGRLLLAVRLAIGCGRNGTADHAGDRNQRQDVRQYPEERRRGRRVDLQAERKGVGEAEEKRRRERAGRPPVPEDHRRERDESSA